MVKGFYTLLIAQFLSAIADNALLFAAIALLAQLNAPTWHEPLLREFFVISYILLAPFVGPFADALPKGRVMFLSNGLKFAGCLLALAGVPPLYAYAVVGIGAAAYSPAKYGILTEMLPSHLLIKANAWMEGTTVTAIILGPVFGSTIAAATSPYVGIAFITLLYLLAAAFNYFIPKVPIDHKVEQKTLKYLLKDFWHAFITLWKDPQGQVSLAVTTLFWGAGATLQFVVLKWADVKLGFTQQEATYLIAILAVGIAAGSVIASRYVQLENAVKVLPAGIYMGILVISMVLITNPIVAAVLLFVIGVLSGYFLVPLNSLLQHRGHHLLGAGHSIAVQNFNENIGILLLLGAYTWMVGAKFEINTIVAIFGVFIIVSMSLITFVYRKHIQR
ncbi:MULTISPECIES: lysophospholipid transporter LplT [unclassified Methylophilus]|jgi:MFS transporter, LPLT family, lysophospholipid transporter|uniref:lysophospholipid transporter LplT n=1 Tax=unclassified Methylophilus TaxID=2630143 RepID=UPI0006F54985|nr:MULTISPECIES: lysophospholipid transporter LplT [unclassified Methylophilus]KQT36107.1 MFS transporter [Methylophilus sp. Leaf414]KQT42397.1 MFS transporter [Methylophilus sp. Leaf416]KQT56580.1 MFS transporter [Methylophilus sp. Leaf459]